MIGEDAIRGIISQYVKYGWQAQRVLLSDVLRNEIRERIGSVFGETQFIASDLDAVWFSRPATGGRVAWELRHLDNDPFALIEVIETSASPTEVESILRQTERRLRERVCDPAHRL